MFRILLRSLRPLPPSPSPVLTSAPEPGRPAHHLTRTPRPCPAGPGRCPAGASPCRAHLGGLLHSGAFFTLSPPVSLTVLGTLGPSSCTVTLSLPAHPVSPWADRGRTSQQGHGTQTPPAAGDVHLDRSMRLVSARFLPREVTVVKFVFGERFVGKYADVARCLLLVRLLSTALASTGDACPHQRHCDGHALLSFLLW